jgi:hypothetical protein
MRKNVKRYKDTKKVSQYITHYMEEDMSVIFDKIGMDMPSSLEGDEYEEIMENAHIEAFDFFLKNPEQMTNKFGDPFFK